MVEKNQKMFEKFDGTGNNGFKSITTEGLHFEPFTALRYEFQHQGQRCTLGFTWLESPLFVCQRHCCRYIESINTSIL